MALHRFDMRRVGLGLLLGLTVLSMMGCRQTGKWPYGYECLGPDGPLCFPCTRWGGYYPTCWDRWPDCSPKCPPPMGPGETPVGPMDGPVPQPLPATPFVPEPAFGPGTTILPQAPSPPVFKPVAPTPEPSPSDNRPKPKALDDSAVPEPKGEGAGASVSPGILPSWVSPDNWRRSGT